MTGPDKKGGIFEPSSPGETSPSDEEKVLIAEAFVFAGKFDQAAQMTAGDILSPGIFSVKALLALLEGRREHALELYEEGLKRIRKEQRTRKVCYDPVSGVFHPLLLLAEGAFKKADALLSAGMEKSRYPSLYALFRFLADFRAGRGSDSLFSVYSVRVCEKQNFPPYFYFFLALCIHWTDIDRLKEYRYLLLNAADSLRSEGGLDLLVTELSEILGMKEKFPILRTLPLNEILPRKEEWMLALTALSGLGNEAVKGAKRLRRLLWEVDWGCGEDGIVRSLNFTPVEQVLQPSGKWSKGRAVALKRLRNDLVREEWMTRQDIAAAGAIRETGGYDGWYYKRWFEFDEGKLVKALPGHPAVFRGGEERSVELVSETPRLEIDELPTGGFSIRMVPHPSKGPFPGMVVSEEGPDRLRIISFEEKHLLMARILGEKGLTVPSKGRNEVLRVLDSLAGIVPISSELEGAGGTPTVEADSRTHIQLVPSGEGFAVTLAVRPLGPEAPAYRPGAGGAAVFGLSGGKRVRTLRKPEEEEKNADEIRTLCPALAEGEQTDNYRWILDSPEICLEFLFQAGALGNGTIVEWPKGGSIKIRARADFKAVRVSVRSVKDWFALSGEILVDEETALSIKEACALLAESKGRFLPLGKGEFLALTEELRKRLEEVSSFGDWKGKDLRLSPLSVPLLRKFSEEAGDFTGDDEWKKRLLLVEKAGKIDPGLPGTFRGELRDYQLEGFRWMIRLAGWGAGACLADDMGLGKTIQALAALLSRAQEGPALVVAPVSVCPNWFSEAARFTPTLTLKEYRNGDRKKLLDELNPFDVVVTSYGLLQHDGALLETIRWNTVVLDEAQAIKNSATKRSAAAMKLSGNFRIITTGTPVENNLGELWNLFRFLNPGLLGSLESFNRRFAIPIEKYGDKGARNRLKKFLRPFLLRRTKDQVLEELPPKTEVVLRVDMTKEERAVYEALRQGANEKIESGGDGRDKRFVVLAELMKLRRACCNTSLVLPEGIGYPSSKLEAFGEILDDLRANVHRCLVFSQFVDHLSILRAFLEERGISYAYLDGSTSSEERKRQVASFQAGEKECFLISLRAGGTGLNLTAADYVVHMDPWWNPAVEDQASDRTHRIGQKRPVTVYRIVAKDTVEEKIADLHAVKRDLAESLLEGTEGAARFSLEDMAALIREK